MDEVRSVEGEEGTAGGEEQTTENGRTAPQGQTARREERTAESEEPRDPEPALCALPDGAMVAADGESYLIARGRPLVWSFGGYREADRGLRDTLLVTPPSTIRALRAGYRPVLHSTALQHPLPSS